MLRILSAHGLGPPNSRRIIHKSLLAISAQTKICAALGNKALWTVPIPGRIAHAQNLLKISARVGKKRFGMGCQAQNAADCAQIRSLDRRAEISNRF